LGRKKGSRNKKTLERMGLDKYRINPQNDGKNIQKNPQNNGSPKKVRRTKAQLIADGYYNKGDKKETKNKETDRSHLFNRGSLGENEVSENMIKRAKARGLENWEQDFRNDYEKGQKIYYVEINDLCHTKELLECYVGTVYSKVMIVWVDRGESHTIGIDDADKIFRDEKEAKKYYQKVRAK
jgi:hypothetical protein